MSCCSEQYLVCMAFDIEVDCEIVMHRFHNSFSQSWHLFILELAPVETENSLECSQHTCAHTWACMSPPTGLTPRQFAAALEVEVGSSAHWPRVPPQNTSPRSSPPSHKRAFSPNCCLPPAPTALPSPEPEMQILAEQAGQAEDQQKQLLPSINHP